MIIARNSEPLRIAYIEDSEEDAQALIKSWTEYLPRITNRLDVYSSGRAYLHQLSVPFPIYHDLILLDLHLPDISGIELGRILKAQPELKKQTILVVTASSEEAAIAAQHLIGAHGWAVKPMRAAGILHEIGRIGKTAPWYGLELVRLTGEQDAEISI